MRRVFDEVAAQYTEVDANHIYVDAAALQLVRQPWIFDVLVTDNMFGDILSDLGAGLMGGMGMAPSADIGQTNAVFQPCHGSAPDIAGDGKANPTAIFLSAAMMPEWLGHQHANASLIEAASAVNRAVENAFAAGDLLPWELGGTDGTDTITRKVFDQMTQR